MLPSTCSREALVACPPCPPWNLPSFTVESILSSPCSRSDPPLTRQGAALAHLDSLPLIIWYSKLTAQFLFLLARAAPTYLPTALSMALRPLFRSVLRSIFLFTSNSVADLAGTVFSLLLFYQTTMGPRTLVSPGERLGWWACQTGSAACALRNPL